MNQSEPSAQPAPRPPSDESPSARYPRAPRLRAAWQTPSAQNSPPPVPAACAQSEPPALPCAARATHRAPCPPAKIPQWSRTDQSQQTDSTESRSEDRPASPAPSSPDHPESRSLIENQPAHTENPPAHSPPRQQRSSSPSAPPHAEPPEDPALSKHRQQHRRPETSVDRLASSHLSGFHRLPERSKSRWLRNP